MFDEFECWVWRWWRYNLLVLCVFEIVYNKKLKMK